MEPAESPAFPDLRALYGEEAWREWQAFVEHFQLARGFALLVLLLPGAGSAVCQRALEGELRIRGRKLNILRPETLIELQSLAADVMAVRLDETKSEDGLWIDLTPNSYDIADAWRADCRRFFGQLNQHRNDLAKRWPLPMVLVGGAWLKADLRESAPDLWSIRTTVVTLVSRGMESGELNESVQWALDTWDSEEAADPEYAMQEARKLRGETSDPRHLVELLLRASGGYQRKGKRALAEATAREARDILERSMSPSVRVNSSMYARALEHHALALQKLGRNFEALAPSEAAVAAYKELAKAKPREFGALLAAASASLGRALQRTEHFETALEVTNEAVRLARDLVSLDGETYRNHLAQMLDGLGSILTLLDRLSEAVEVTREAVQVCRERAPEPSNRDQRMLAGILQNLGFRLVLNGRHAEATGCFEEAVGILEKMTIDGSEEPILQLASSLFGAAQAWGYLGEHQRALRFTEDALRILLPGMERRIPAELGFPIAGLAAYLRLCSKAAQRPDEKLVDALRAYEKTYNRFLRRETEP
jgi:tetratricopeptide (TPR) repeat protein